KEILTEDYKVLGVLTDDSVEHYDDVVISDIGVRETSKLCKFPKYYLKEIKKVKPSEGIKISVAVEERLIRHTGILFTPNCERIDGLNQVTNVDPTLAPKEKHLVLTHQFLHSNNLRKEAELGLSDFERLFGDRKYEILTISSHRAKNPVNRAASGYDLDQRTPIKGLYLVGDCAKVSGGMDVDGIALGVRKVYNYIKEDFNQKS
ncbi:MAG: NAD(P)/FAD-dependent oxidoreductase, partial [Candidatus Methanofastidiosia archaeon]